MPFYSTSSFCVEKGRQHLGHARIQSPSMCPSPDSIDLIHSQRKPCRLFHSFWFYVDRCFGLRKLFDILIDFFTGLPTKPNKATLN